MKKVLFAYNLCSLCCNVNAAFLKQELIINKQIYKEKLSSGFMVNITKPLKYDIQRDRTYIVLRKLHGI